jgi:predicted anti-sigma-YlaC factor YlaD
MGSDNISDDVIIEHLEICPNCRELVASSPELEAELGSMTLSPAPVELVGMVMSAVSGIERKHKRAAIIKSAPVVTVAFAYTLTALAVIFNWEAMPALPKLDRILGLIPQFLGSLAHSVLSASGNVGSNIGHLPLAFIMASVILTTAALWAFTLIGFRDVLKS